MDCKQKIYRKKGKWNAYKEKICSKNRGNMENTRKTYNHIKHKEIRGKKHSRKKVKNTKQGKQEKK